MDMCIYQSMDKLKINKCIDRSIDRLIYHMLAAPRVLPWLHVNSSNQQSMQKEKEVRKVCLLFALKVKTIF